LALLNNLEHEELFGGLRSVPLRALPALGTTLLLYLSGDMLNVWPLAWVALAPLCFACRGAGPLAALLLAALSLLAAAFSQTFWLLDVEGAAPLSIWLAGGLLPAIAFAALELPICRKIPWALRPLLLAVLATGFWALLPGEAALLIPLGGLIGGDLLGWAWPKLGPATVAGGLAGLGWLAAEMFHKPRRPESRWPGWQGVLVAGLLLLAGGIDWWGSSAPATRSYMDQVTLHVITDGDDPVGATEKALAAGPGRRIVIWRAIAVRDDAERGEWIRRAGELAASRGLVLVSVLAAPDATYAYVFPRGAVPSAQKRWPGEPGHATGEPLVIGDSWEMQVYPSLDAEPHWSTPWSTDVYTTPLEPAHPAQERWWIREQRRSALVRGSRQICTWAGGGIALDGRANVLGRGNGQGWFTTVLPAAQHLGEPMGHERLRVLERILRFAAPVLALMLLGLTPISWLKRRRRLQSSQAVAIEEVFDPETTLTKDETDQITRRYKRGDMKGD
jgi:hypothetical protein